VNQIEFDITATELEEALPVRIHSECMTSEVFGSLRQRAEVRLNLGDYLDVVVGRRCGLWRARQVVDHLSQPRKRPIDRLGLGALVAGRARRTLVLQPAELFHFDDGLANDPLIEIPAPLSRPGDPSQPGVGAAGVPAEDAAPDGAADTAGAVPEHVS